MTVTFFNSTV